MPVTSNVASFVVYHVVVLSDKTRTTTISSPMILMSHHYLYNFVPAKGQISMYNPAPLSLLISTVGLVLPGNFFITFVQVLAVNVKLKGKLL